MERFLPSRQVHYPLTINVLKSGHEVKKPIHIRPSLGKSGSIHCPKVLGSEKDGSCPRIRSRGYNGLPCELVILPQLSFFVSCCSRGINPGNGRRFQFFLNRARYSICSKLPRQFKPLRNTRTVKPINRPGQRVLSLSIRTRFSSSITMEELGPSNWFSWKDRVSSLIRFP